jgi:cytochrome c oxidase subunit II
MWLR